MVLKNINLKNVVIEYRLGFEKKYFNFCLDIIISFNIIFIICLKMFILICFIG